MCLEEVCNAKILYRKLEEKFPERKLRGLSLNFYIHLSVSDRLTSVFGFSKIGGPININRSQMYEYGSWEQGRAVSFLGMHNLDLLCSVVHV